MLKPILFVMVFVIIGIVTPNVFATSSSNNNWGIFEVKLDKSVYHTGDIITILLDYDTTNICPSCEYFGQLRGERVSVQTNLETIDVILKEMEYPNDGIFTADIYLNGLEGDKRLFSDGYTISNMNDDIIQITIDDPFHSTIQVSSTILPNKNQNNVSKENSSLESFPFIETSETSIQKQSPSNVDSEYFWHISEFILIPIIVIVLIIFLFIIMKKSKKGKPKKNDEEKYDKHQLDNGNYDEDGYDKNGFDVNDYNKNGKHKIEYVELIASVDSTHEKPKLFLNSISGNVHFRMIPFKGEEKFAKMISGGNFDFYDNDAPAYILQIKFDGWEPELQEKFVQIIRRTFPKKFQIFPTNYSIGAYWINDRITEDNAAYYLRRILENYIFSKF